MSRVNESEVKKIMVSDPGDVQLAIDTANVIVTDDLGGSNMNDDRLKLVELWLSAHFAAIWNFDSGAAQMSSGEDSFEYAGGGTTGYGQTRYGQQAMALDATGNLAQEANKARSGKPDSLFSAIGPSYNRTA